MNRDKQIEEMARSICNCYHRGICEMDGNSCDLECGSAMNAYELYNAGYRKASEVAREIFEEIENALELLQRCVEEGRKNDGIKYQQLHDGRILSIEAVKYFVAELKIKYKEKDDEQR